ncbi:hypothetical protein P152DRAFT_405397 [Eremomyces bilateralis CBS 781.70]|uniref:SprT-like domain-containing protein n=1 Tax=Eremomyces bilateralis CBS 781.70 TaxID=1392243 RepID=A0A6G1FRZ4_9PEZI|nr:uncharacterized protein P152DRAFT_405397 [Eremomyces bilateralis CBS 781.70]KAF1808498.1 hypothetical protein P152DRAFT_405397 [Eremomyces bilateralis CBS 781.70]
MTLPNFLHVGENGNPSQPLIVDINAGGLDPPSPKKSPHKQDPQRAARRAFDLIKHRLAEQWLQELDDKICAGKIAAKTKATGGVKIVWSKNLQVTAGRARWRKDLDKNKISRGEETEERHVASIELAEKVIDDADRLRNVVAHEFCHLATYMVSGVKNNPHGKEFKYWGSQCSKAFRDQNIIVTTKHSYEISYKYIWECVECGYEYKRQSKSVDINRHSCGICKARLVQTKPVPRAASGKVSEYQLFVKENFRRLKAEHSNLTHGEVMEKMGKLYRERKKEAAVTQRSNIDALTHQLDVVVLDD